jgi:hypothetical protein
MRILRPNTAWPSTAISSPLSTVVATKVTSALTALLPNKPAIAVNPPSGATCPPGPGTTPAIWFRAKPVRGTSISCVMVTTMAASPSVATGLARM